MGIKDVQMRGGDMLPVRQFKLSDIVDNASIMMIAKRGSGKSWITKAIMMHFSDIPCGIVIAPTDRMNSFYNDFYPDTSRTELALGISETCSLPEAIDKTWNWFSLTHK